MTELETPIRIRWTGKARRKVHGHNLDFDSERSDHVARALDRQQTNVVIETVAEAEAIANEMDRYRHDGGKRGRVWVNGAIASACDRIRSTVISEMSERGYEREDGGRHVSFTERDDDHLTPEDVVERAREFVQSHGGAEISVPYDSWTVTDPEDVAADGNAVKVGNAAFSPTEHTEVTPLGGE